MMWGDCTGSENTLGDKKCMGMKQGYSCTDCMWLSFPWSLSNDTNGCAILATRTIHRHVDSLFDQWCNHPSADIQCQMCTVPVPWANSETTDKTSHMTRCCTIETKNYSPHPPHSWSCMHIHKHMWAASVDPIPQCMHTVQVAWHTAISNKLGEEDENLICYSTLLSHLNCTCL